MLGLLLHIHFYSQYYLFPFVFGIYLCILTLILLRLVCSYFYIIWAYIVYCVVLDSWVLLGLHVHIHFYSKFYWFLLISCKYLCTCILSLNELNLCFCKRFSSLYCLCRYFCGLSLLLNLDIYYVSISNIERVSLISIIWLMLSIFYSQFSY